MRKKNGIRFCMEKGKEILTAIFLIIYLYPIILVFLSSVKTKQEMAVNPSGLPKEISFDYFQKAFKSMNYLKTISNTAMIAAAAVFFLLIFASMAAYAIARQGKRYTWIYFLFLAGMMVPFQMRMTPLYKLVLSMGLMNRLTGVICIYMGSLAPMAVFILTGFVKTIPKELEEAAYIDGAGIYLTYFKIVMPLLKSALVTVAITNAFAIWNDFLMPMMFLQNRDKSTLTVMLANFQGMYFNDWSMIFAGVCLIVLPMLIIYLFAQRFIVDGLTGGAVKG